MCKALTGLEPVCAEGGAGFDIDRKKLVPVRVQQVDLHPVVATPKINVGRQTLVESVLQCLGMTQVSKIGPRMACVARAVGFSTRSSQHSRPVYEKYSSGIFASRDLRVFQGGIGLFWKTTA